MKYLTLLFITISAHAQFVARIDYAQFVAHIDYVNPIFADGQLNAKDQAGIDKEIESFIKKRERRGEKCVNNECFKTIKVKAVYELDEKGKIVYDENGEPNILEPAKVIEEKFLEISIEDISQEVADKEAEKLAKELRKEELKAEAKKEKDLTKEEIKEILLMVLEGL